MGSPVYVRIMLQLHCQSSFVELRGSYQATHLIGQPQHLGWNTWHIEVLKAIFSTPTGFRLVVLHVQLHVAKNTETELLHKASQNGAQKVVWQGTCT